MAAYESIFMRDFTCIDYAFVNDHGKVVGGSYFPEIVISGKIDEKEQVVADFSSIKKRVKDIIDDPLYGFDHKLIIIEGISRCTVHNLKNDYIEVVTPFHRITGPQNMIHTLPYWKIEHFDFIMENEIGLAVQNALNAEEGHMKFTIDLKLNKRPRAPEDVAMFTYVHGLKYSSSWKCQNIAHGHLSFVEVYNKDGKRNLDVEKMIAQYLNKAIIVSKEHLVNDEIAYECERGKFSMSFGRDVKLIVMDKEPTIENIADFLVEKHKPVFEYYGIEKMYISEGLQKGCVKIIA